MGRNTAGISDTGREVIDEAGLSAATYERKEDARDAS